jgi:hypothetical protein
MAAWTTLTERKQARLATLRQAVAELRAVLSAYRGG